MRFTIHIGQGTLETPPDTNAQMGTYELLNIPHPGEQQYSLNHNGHCQSVWLQFCLMSEKQNKTRQNRVVLLQQLLSLWPQFGMVVEEGIMV